MLTSYWGLGGSFLTNIFDKFHKLGPENRPKTRLLVLAIVALPPFVLAYSGLVARQRVVLRRGLQRGDSLDHADPDAALGA